MKAAAQGDDEKVDNKDDPDIRQLYNRDHHEYPYKSHGQYLRACYALMGCSLFIIFNGWRTFVTPMSVADFLACYIAVRPSFACISLVSLISFNYPVACRGVALC
jgi:yeast amino acid transporter